MKITSKSFTFANIFAHLDLVGITATVFSLNFSLTLEDFRVWKISRNLL